MYYYIFLGFIGLIITWAIGSYLVIRNLEEPSYTVLEKRNGYEIREYAPYITAETEVTGTYSEALNEGFRIIADYIFGNNTAKESIAMTAPVLQNKSEEIAMTVPVLNTETNAENRTIAFVLPSKYTFETLPTPNNSRVILSEKPAQKKAVLRFTWYATESRVAKKIEDLKTLLEKDGVSTFGPVQVAQYNPPFSFPLTHRNEIIISITE